MIHRLLTVLTLTIFFTGSVYSQYYVTGQDPASLKWVQIRTGRFRVIYPEKYGKNGEQFARSLEDAYSALHAMYPEKKFRIPVIIHNFTTTSNGYVAWAPKRMEIYPTPEQNTIPLDPVKQLTFHETTHVLQMVSLNKGFSKALSLMAGEQIFGLDAFLLPLWFMEGDAVLAETALTGSGRGRSPSFQKEFRAIAVEKNKLYNYDQIVSGSFKHYVPDHYQSGYQIVTWTLLNHGDQVWNNMLDYTAKYPFTLNPVNLSLRKTTGLTKNILYRQTFENIQASWEKNLSQEGALMYPELNPPKNENYINYYSPVIAGTDSIIAIKTSLSRIPSFVLINRKSREEKIIHSPGQIYPWHISYSKGILVWVETIDDPRWANRQYSVIKTFDLRSGLSNRISGRSRYLSAAISPDGQTVAASENTTDNNNNLVFIDIRSKAVISSIPAPGNAYLQRPQWSAEGNRVICISLAGNGEGIVAFDTNTRLWSTLLPEGRNDLQSAVIRNDSLFYVSSFSGTENIYVQTPGNKAKNLTNSRFGATDLCLNDGEVIFSDYSSSGNKVAFSSIKANVQEADSLTGSADYLVNQLTLKPVEEKVRDSSVYNPVPYRKWLHPFKFHSWMPFYADLETIKSDPAAVRPGLTLMSQNDLSTLISSVGYEYSQDGRHLLHSRITWQGWYPVIDSRIDYGYMPAVSKFGENVESPQQINPGFQFTNILSIPLNFTSGKFFRYLQPSVTSEYFNNYVYIKDDKTYDYGQNLISGRIYFSNYQIYSYRDIYPRWAQTIDISYTYAPWDRNIYGSSISFRSALYFPGILPNNSIRLRFEKEKQEPQKYLLSSKISLPRGYENIISRDMYLASADYVMPLIYPDIHLSGLLYIKRIRTSLFYDYAEGTGNTYYENTSEGLRSVAFHDYREKFSSAGLELIADFHLFRIPYMISGGVQAAWTKGNELPVYKMLLNIDMFGMAIGKRGGRRPRV